MTSPADNHSESKAAQQSNKGWYIAVVAFLLIALPLGWWRFAEYQKQARWKRRAELNTRCRQLADEGKWAEVEQLALEWRDWNPDSDESLLFLADARLNQGDVVEAQDYLQQIPDTSDKVVPSLLMASELLLGPANLPLAAPETLQRILEIDPLRMTAQQRKTAQQRLIFFYALTLQRTKMLKQLRQAVATRSEPIEAYVYLVLSSHMTLTNGISFTSRWLQSDPENELLKVARAVHYADTMDSVASADEEPEAEKQARYQSMVNLLTEFPQNRTLLRYFLGKQIQDFDVEAVGQLLEQIPKSTDESLFWRYRGWYHAQKDEIQKAERAYRESLNFDRLDWHVWHELAGVLRRNRELDEAEKMQKISVAGKDLRKELRQMPNVAAVTPELLTRIRDYAELCGDVLVTRSLSARIEEMNSAPSEPLPMTTAN